MDRMKEYGIITVIALIAIIAAIYIQYQGSDDHGNGEKLEDGDYILKSSFEVGDYYGSYYSNKDKGDVYTIIGIDPKDSSRYDVQKNDSIRSMTYDDFKSMLAPDLEELKKEATSFTDRGIETLDTCVGKAKCHTYDAEFALQGGGSYHRIYYMTDSGILFKTVNIHPTGEYVYSGIDSTSMVTDTVYPDTDAKKVKGDAGYTEYTVKDSTSPDPASCSGWMCAMRRTPNPITTMS